MQPCRTAVGLSHSAGMCFCAFSRNTYPNYFTLNAALPQVLSNTPANCEDSLSEAFGIYVNMKIVCITFSTVITCTASGWGNL